MVISEGHVRHDGLSWVQGALSSSELLEDDFLLVRPGPQRDDGGPRAAEGHRMYGYGYHTPYPSTWGETAGISVWLCLCAGYNLSPQAMNVIMKRFSTNGRIAFDDFITCCVKLRALTGEWAGGKHQPSQMSSIQQGYLWHFDPFQITSEGETRPKMATPPFTTMM